MRWKVASVFTWFAGRFEPVFSLWLKDRGIEWKQRIQHKMIWLKKTSYYPVLPTDNIGWLSQHNEVDLPSFSWSLQQSFLGSNTLPPPPPKTPNPTPKNSKCPLPKSDTSNPCCFQKKLDRLGFENKDSPCTLGREGKSVEQCRARVTVTCDHVTVTD